MLLCYALPTIEFRSNAVADIREYKPDVLLLDFYIPPYTGLEVRLYLYNLFNTLDCFESWVVYKGGHKYGYLQANYTLVCWLFTICYAAALRIM